MEYDSAIKKERVLIHVVVRMDLENMRLSEKKADAKGSTVWLPQSLSPFWWEIPLERVLSRTVVYRWGTGGPERVRS